MWSYSHVDDVEFLELWGLVKCCDDVAKDFIVKFTVF